LGFIAALILLVAFTANVVMGALGDARFVGNVAEMVVLLAAAIAFVVGVLQREARDKKDENINH
jgi:hypothetical protein